MTDIFPSQVDSLELLYQYMQQCIDRSSSRGGDGDEIVLAGLRVRQIKKILTEMKQLAVTASWANYD
jgi:hypothetical protein